MTRLTDAQLAEYKMGLEWHRKRVEFHEGHIQRLSKLIEDEFWRRVEDDDVPVMREAAKVIAPEVMENTA